MARSRQIQSDSFKEAPLLDHLEELRWRIIWAVVAWIVGSGVTFQFLGVVSEILKRPLEVYANGRDYELVQLRIGEGFTTSFVIAAAGGLILAMPFILYQVWAFIAPGLTKRERGYAIPFIFGSLLAFAAGLSFAYFVALPFALPFLLSFFPGVKVTLQLGDYIGDIITPLVMFGLLFQLPVLMFLISKIGIISSAFFAAQRRIAVFAIVILAALVTPTTDPVNLAISAVPLILLYEVGILLSRIAERQNLRAAKLAALQEPALDDFE
jgi:sec-independent protein translocase protein TatC